MVWGGVYFLLYLYECMCSVCMLGGGIRCVWGGGGKGKGREVQRCASLQFRVYRCVSLQFSVYRCVLL